MIQTIWNIDKFLAGAPTSSCHFFHTSVCPYVRLLIRCTPYLRHSTSSDHRKRAKGKKSLKWKKN